MENQKPIGVNCPNCKERIMVNNPGNMDSLKVKCPACRNIFTLKIKKKPVHPNVQQAQFYSSSGGQQESTAQDETVHINLSGFGGNPALMVNGQRFALRVGRNVVGRSSPDSMATLQIPTNDMYMSRNNAILEVKKTETGALYVLLSSCNERNLACVNGNQVLMGNRVVLQPGSLIKLGHTQIKYVVD